MTVAEAVTWSSGFGLTLTAGNNLNINAAISNSGAGAMTFNATTINLADLTPYYMQQDENTVNANSLAEAQGIPQNFLENILGDLRQAGLVRSQRGAEGGFRLAKPADQISVADVAEDVWDAVF